MGDNGGPAPASETRINAIPTVKITAAQARMLFDILYRKKRDILELI